MADIVVEASGGVIVGIYCDDPKVRLVVIDWDELEPSRGTPHVGAVWDSCPPLSELSDETRMQFQHAIAEKTGDEPRIVRT